MKHVSSTSDEAFASYFDRFVNLTEPSFVPLDPRNEVPPAQANQDELSSGSELPTDQAAGPIGKPKPLGTQEEESWLQSYARHLSEDIDSEAESETPLSKDVTALKSSVGDIRARRDGAQDVLENSVQMASAILTSMSGGGVTSPAVGVGQFGEAWGETPLGLQANMFPFGDFVDGNMDMGSRFLEQMLAGGDDIWTDMMLGQRIDDTVTVP